MDRMTIGALALATTCAWSDTPTWLEMRARWLAHPRLESARATVRDAAADALLAGQSPPWKLEIAVENAGGTGGKSGIGGSTQEFWASREFHPRSVATSERDLARSATGAAALDTLLIRRELLLDARRHWDRWVGERKIVALLDSQIAEMREWQRTSEREVNAGKAPSWETQRIRADLAMLGSLRERRSRNAAASWLRTNPPGADSIEEPDSMPEDATLPSLRDSAPPDSLAIHARLRIALAEQALADAVSGPVVDLGGGILRDQATGDLGAGFRISMPVPWNRVDWQRAKARSTVRLLERERMANATTRTRKRSELTNAVLSVRIQLDDLRLRVLPQLAEAREGVHAAWIAGGVSWMERRNVSDAWWNARLEELELEAATRGLELERMELEGLEP